MPDPRLDLDRETGAMAPGAVLVLGIGNVLMSDEGVGVHVVQRLRATALPEGCVAIDGGTLGIELLPLVEACSALVLIDAARFGGAPGEVRIFRGAGVAGSYGGHLSPHQAGAGDLIAVARLTGVLPERCALIGIEPETTGFGLELSPAVAAGAALAAAFAAEESARFQREVTHA